MVDPDGRVCRNLSREIDTLGPDDDAKAQALITVLQENDCIPSGESTGAETLVVFSSGIGSAGVRW